MPLLDTRQGRDLTGTLISDIVLQLLSYVAQSERENIRQRQAEGIAAAKAKGVRFGPDRRVLPDNFEELRQAWRNKQMTLRAAAEACVFPRPRSGTPPSGWKWQEAQNKAGRSGILFRPEF